MRTVDPVRHGEKRRQILDAAQRCFAREGFGRASIANLCAEAGISPGHLYHYFESKEAILGAIIQRLLEDVSAKFGRTLESSDALAALIADAQRAKVRKDDGEPVLMLDVLADAGRNPAVAGILQTHSRVMREMLADFLRRGQARGGIDPTLDAEMAAAVLIGMIDASKIMAVRDPSLDRARMIESLQTMIVRFLTPQDRAAAQNGA